MSSVEDKDRGLARILRDVAASKASTVELSAGDVGVFHEYGLGVPARPFMAPTLDNRADEIAKQAGNELFGPMLDGRGNAREDLEQIGEQAVEFVQQTIRQQDPSWAPLAESTVKAKGHARPLVATGELLKSISARVVIGGGA